MKNNATCWIWLIAAALVAFQQCQAETEHHLDSIFLPSGSSSSYCDLDCPGAQQHTLCEQPEEWQQSPEHCRNFQQLLGSAQLWMNILDAHNGVRNRFAMRYRVSNMRKLVWDDELARMARLHLASCERYNPDPCTVFPDSLSTRNHRNVRQSKAFVIERYLPKYYAMDVLRGWYLQKDETPLPSVREAHLLYQPVLNNFTLLTWAGLERVGCAAAKYRDGFQLVCNYFPFYSLSQPSAELGLPAVHCPRTFPLRSRIFSGLCTFEMDQGVCLKPPQVLLLLLIAWCTLHG
uniref:SCP domain-containing protein n=1 Tax=Anopheles farauti TaxID=69004 RepID=A0A182QDQ1_9DIPT